MVLIEKKKKIQATIKISERQKIVLDRKYARQINFLRFSTTYWEESARIFK